ncbi:hypothetical protein TNCV_2106881 [Trichonephila clavipes]|nr:hypothetical protein TNCV_2106881 [Trichonephila clavipes]
MGRTVALSPPSLITPWVSRWLEHRTPDQKALVQRPIPPNTLRVHTEYVLVKLVGLKVLWAESRVQGTGEYFHSLNPMAKLWWWRLVVSPSFVPSGNFAELIRTVTCTVT